MENNIVFRQLKASDRIGAADLAKIAGLIYDTDIFISPCMFNSRRDAQRVLSRVFETNEDGMFKNDNIFAAEINGETTGIILWHKGPLNWDTDVLERQAEKEGVELSPHLSVAKERYFDAYSDVSPDTVSLINVCVDEDFRNCGIGTRLIGSFVALHGDENMELYTLADNEAAVKIYNKAGFKIDRTLQGFSLDQRDLPCFLMKYSVVKRDIP